MSLSKKFIVHGNKRLQGEVRIGGSKNAALPIIAATVLASSPCTLHNVPRIEDVFSMIEILKGIGATITFEENTLFIDPTTITSGNITGEQAKRMRASILLLPPLLARFGEAKIPFPGGCVLGKRPIDTHLLVFEALGAEVVDVEGCIHVKASKLSGNTVVLNELSVTASENALMAAVKAEGNSSLRLLATEPHVTDLCHFLTKMGAKISGIGANFMEVEGVSELEGCEYSITPDYLETGAFAIAAALTKGDVKITHTDPSHLDIMWTLMKQMGVPLEIGEDYVHVRSYDHTLKAIPRLQTGVYPQFPTDLQAPFAILFTQAEGVSKVFETLFEGRLNYLMELEKMHAHVEVLNPHQAIIIGPTQLKGAIVSSWDIRAGTAIVLAALAAEGKSEITNIYYIDRGYEHIEKKLNALGADITRVEEEA